LTADQDKTVASTPTAGTSTRQVFRSPVVLAVWWIWVLFAVANLIDLAVQGHDHISLVAALTLVLVTGVLYVGAWRPRIVADDSGLTVVNPLRDHQIGWAGVAAVESTEMLRVRCEWPGGKKSLYAWAINSSRRRQVNAQVRAQRRARPRRGVPNGGLGAGPARFAASPPAPAPTPDPSDADRVITALRRRADAARASGTEVGGARLLSTWSWPALAAIGVPALVLVLVILL
jgi:hypothetical protein